MNPVLFLTGKSDIRDKVEGLQQGGDYYLTEPYNFDEFLAVIQMLLERQKLEIQTAKNWKSGLQETGSPERKKIEVRTARIWMEIILR